MFQRLWFLCYRVTLIRSHFNTNSSHCWVARQTKNKKEANNDIKKREEGLAETAISLYEQKHSLSNENHWLCTSGIKSFFQLMPLMETLSAADGVKNKNLQVSESLLGVSVDMMSFNLFSFVDWLWWSKDVSADWSVYLFIAW